jgi:hypothetical protein
MHSPGEILGDGMRDRVDVGDDALPVARCEIGLQFAQIGAA